jgi:hypothetical protein
MPRNKFCPAPNARTSAKALFFSFSYIRHIPAAHYHLSVVTTDVFFCKIPVDDVGMMDP